MTFELGDRVKIKKSSQYYGQSKTIGTITLKEVYPWWRVTFDDGTVNSYREKDLKPVIINWQERLK